MSEEYVKVLRYSLILLSRKRYTVHEMEGKLSKYVKKRDIDEKVCDEVMGRLRELKYMDDLKFVKDYVDERMRLRPRGERLMRLELYKKGIKKLVIEKGISEVDIDEEEMARRVFESKSKKWGGLPGWKQKQRAFAYLFSKGFKRDAIYKVVESGYNQRVIRNP
ncbi:MAG: regulatory protein RecX [Candidatus Peregrinibacteria bacterium]